ncbi:hypothetical protein DFP97_1425 [Paenibacillus prosopidis]|uniref:DUF4181 domain-containing protein n=1 Tax=Paenibacillus prosopidis TaxID=630520 RepID=A0A368VHG9_9BACL|nr:hypothetical protein DFP97_1425 [Paenibacillus prosopidis]
MGLFFEKRESTKPFIIIRILLMIVIVFIFVIGIVNDFDFFFMRLLFMLLGVSSILDGIERYLKRENKWRYYFDFGMGLLWFVSSFIFWK